MIPGTRGKFGFSSSSSFARRDALHDVSWQGWRPAPSAKKIRGSVLSPVMVLGIRPRRNGSMPKAAAYSGGDGEGRREAVETEARARGVGRSAPAAFISLNVLHSSAAEVTVLSSMNCSSSNRSNSEGTRKSQEYPGGARQRCIWNLESGSFRQCRCQTNQKSRQAGNGSDDSDLSSVSTVLVLERPRCSHGLARERFSLSEDVACFILSKLGK